VGAPQNLRGLASFELRSEGSFRGWMVRVVESCVREQWRQGHAQRRDRSRVVRISDDHDESAVALATLDPSPSAVATLRESGERVERALLILDDRHRRVIELRSLCRMSYDEIALELGLGVASSARALFARAAAKLAAELGDSAGQSGA
jgi:RNA polymerase sigma factor (sigma-70 family)